ncbi:MAG: GGDEF domain-containing protein [Pseudobutyrivibrio sp.]|nr:GGDEF domain-containing protein [Pseudobutyrivibrio sp.]
MAVAESVPNTADTVDSFIQSLNFTSNDMHLVKAISGENVKHSEDCSDELLNMIQKMNEDNHDPIKKEQEEIEKLKQIDQLAREDIIRQRNLEIAKQRAEEEASIREEKQNESLAEFMQLRSLEDLYQPDIPDDIVDEAVDDIEIEVTEQVHEPIIDWKYEATHDSLTGLLNKIAFEEDILSFNLEKGILVFYDINNLKATNDFWGHEAGNKLIKTVATEINRQFNNQSYRIGGGNFIVITEGKKKEIENKISLITKALVLHTKKDNNRIIYSVSKGIAFADGKKELIELKKEANQLLESDKKRYKEPVKKIEPQKKELNVVSSEESKWKELALKDKRTGCYNKTALDFKKITKLDSLTLISLKNNMELKMSLLEEKTALLSELLLKCFDNESVFYIEKGRFIVFNAPEKDLESFKIKANTMALDVNYGQGTNFKEIDGAIDALEEEISQIPQKNIPYDERLSANQRRLKAKVQDKHEPIGAEDFEDIQNQIRRRSDEIIAIFMASSDFNHLFIFADATEFLEMIYELDGAVDFSYIYAMYQGGALYYGADEYSKEVTDLFQTIADGIPVDQEISERDIQRIKGINTFEHVYIQ